jgi:ectoine hydroxylase-related dioxygenase (phytanoyl-CoA dioxygenase family)
MDAKEMTNEENYCFDVAGYLHIPGVLNRAEVEALNGALDELDAGESLLGSSHRDLFRDLMVNPQLVWYFNQIIGYGFRLEDPPELLGVGASESAVGKPLGGGNEPRDPVRAYYHQNALRSCQGVKAIWALADVNQGDGGLVMVRGSHKSNVETPEDIATGHDDMGLTFQPVLKAGDLLMVADTLLQGLRPWKGEGPQRLLAYGYSGRAAVRSNGTGPASRDDSYPEWMKALTPEQRAVLYKPGYKEADPAPNLGTDGTRVWTNDTPLHPSIYIKDPDSTIDEKEFYFWDLCGHLVLKNVMNAEWITRANEAIDQFEDKIVVGEELARGSKIMQGTGRPTLGGLLQLPEPYCNPFREMIAHAAVIHRLNWMIGSGYRTGGPTAFCSVEGSTGHSLHDANEPLSPYRSYVFQNGRSYTSGGPAVTVTWQLRDVPAGLGGFACVPGSHKAYYRMPEGIRTCDDDMGLVEQPVMQAGDVLFFMDGGQTHGTLAWKNPIPRRALLIKYQSRNFNWAGGAEDPEDRWGDLVEGMTEEQFSLMRGPTRDSRAKNVPRLQVDQGKVEVLYNAEGDLYPPSVRKPGEKR